MTRKKVVQNKDNLIQGIRIILKNRRSLSEEDTKLLKEVIEILQALDSKKRGTQINRNNINKFVKVVELITKFLIIYEDVSKITDLFK